MTRKTSKQSKLVTFMMSSLMRWICFMLTLALLFSCAGCSPVEEDKYTYEKVWFDLYPGDNDIFTFDSFCTIRECYRSALDGNERIRSEKLTGYVDRNLFLTVYDILKEFTILVPRDSNISLHNILITAVDVDDVYITFAYKLPSDIGISITMQSPRHTKEFQVLYESWEYAIPEIYKGAGFEGHVQSSSPKSTDVYIVTDTNRGTWDGYVTVGDKKDVYWKELFDNHPTIEDIATVLDYFETANFHEVVQKAK